MKLFDVPRRRYVRVLENEETTGGNTEGGDVRVPPSAPPINHGDIIYFDHIDGMFSYCKDESGAVVHLIAWQEVEVVAVPAWA